MSSAPSTIHAELVNYGAAPPAAPLDSQLLLLQEMEQMRCRISRDEVNVEVESGPSGPELGAVLSGLRSQYEGIVKSNKEQAEQWYHKKVCR